MGREQGEYMNLVGEGFVLHAFNVEYCLFELLEFLLEGARAAVRDRFHL